ncbi:50S ribosome-binding GTPase [Candidatus Woesearchaeota archaeon]|nr:50S ribosome-binding GTPase [Candidatus Woesearchaeota archaeon]
MPSFWKHVNEVIRLADMVIEVLDARMIEETRNKEIERKIRKYGKTIIYAINKSDLIPKEEAEEIKAKLIPSVFLSSTRKLGTTLLKKKLMELSKGERVVVGVVGYPNVGKSSLINALSGKSATRTSASSGFTKGLQKIRVGKKITFLDTPGVFPEKEKNEFKHGLTGAVDYAKIKDPELVALKLIEKNKELICRFYGSYGDDAEEILELIGIKYHKLSSGSKINMDATARMVLKDWQAGKIKKSL